MFCHCGHRATPEGYAAEEYQICQCKCDPDSKEYIPRYPAWHVYSFPLQFRRPLKGSSCPTCDGPVLAARSGIYGYTQLPDREEGENALWGEYYPGEAEYKKAKRNLEKRYPSYLLEPPPLAFPLPTLRRSQRSLRVELPLISKSLIIWIRGLTLLFQMQISHQQADPSPRG